MKCVLVTLLSIFVASSVGWSSGLRVRFGIGDYGSEYFIQLPMSVSDATDESWTQEPRANDLLPTLILYCHASRIICLLYDDTEYVAGIQVAFPEDEFTDAVVDWTTAGYSEWTPSDNKTYWATQQYFVNEEYLAISAEERIANRDSDKTLQLGGVWVSGINGELLKIEANVSGILDAGFTEQACIPLMGHHYFGNMTTSLSCTDETLFPWFALTDRSDELIASGLITYGKFPEEDGDWFERPPRLAVRLIAPRGPDCLYDLASSPGLVTIHIYYVSTPWTIIC